MREASMSQERLSAALWRATYREDPATRRELFDVLAASDLMVPLEHSRSRVREHLTVEGPDGRRYLIAFTSLHALRSWVKARRPYVELPAARYFARALRSEVA